MDKRLSFGDWIMITIIGTVVMAACLLFADMILPRITRSCEMCTITGKADRWITTQCETRIDRFYLTETEAELLETGDLLAVVTDATRIYKIREYSYAATCNQ